MPFVDIIPETSTTPTLVTPLNAGGTVGTPALVLPTSRIRELGLKIVVDTLAGGTFSVAVQTAPIGGALWTTTNDVLNGIAANGIYVVPIQDIVLDQVRLLITAPGGVTGNVTCTWNYTSYGTQTVVRHLAGGQAALVPVSGGAGLLDYFFGGGALIPIDPNIATWALVIIITGYAGGPITGNLFGSPTGAAGVYVQNPFTTGALAANGVYLFRGDRSLPQYAKVQFATAGFVGTMSVYFRYLGTSEGEILAPGFYELPTGTGPSRLVGTDNLVANVTTILGQGLEVSGGLARVRTPGATAGILRDGNGIAVLPDPANALGLGAGGLLIKPGAITPAQLNGGLFTSDVLEQVTTINAAQLLALVAAPIPIAPAGGVNTITEIVSIFLWLDFGTIAYTIVAAADLMFVYTGGVLEAAPRCAHIGFINSGVDAIRHVPGAPIALIGAVGDLVPLINTSVSITQVVGGAEYVAGDGLLKIRTLYRIKPSLW